jgi:hypothetical protein
MLPHHTLPEQALIHTHTSGAHDTVPGALADATLLARGALGDPPGAPSPAPPDGTSPFDHALSAIIDHLLLVEEHQCAIGLCRKFCSGGREGADTPVCGRD